MTSIGRSVGLLLIVSTTLATACAHAPTNPIADPPEVRTAIEGTLVQFGAAMKRADAGAIASMFTEDGEVIVATTKGFITGRAAIEEFWRARFKAARFIDVAIATVSVQVAGNTAYETGTSRSTVQAGGSPPVRRAARYLTVWKRQPTGVWLIRVDDIIPDPAD